VLVASVLVVFTSGAAASDRSTRGAASPEVVRVWSQAIRATALPGAGCFDASYPVVRWRAVQCAAASRAHHNPRRGPVATDTFVSLLLGGYPGTFFEVGNGHNLDAEVPSGTIESAVGTVPSVSAGATEKDSKDRKAESYSLQLNSQEFSTPACEGAAGCTGWEQFIYEAAPGNQVEIEYWLLGYAGKCPHGWERAGQSECARKSAASALPGGAVPVSGLTGITFEGAADSSSGTDAVVMVTGSGRAVATGAADMLGLDEDWKVAEFGVFGWANGSKAVFIPDTTIMVNTAIHSASKAAPICVEEGETAESNNLTFEAAPSLSPQPYPTISTQQTNGPVLNGDECASYGTPEPGTPTAIIADPPADAIYSYAQQVEAEFSCEAAPGATLQSCRATDDGRTIDSRQDIDTTSATTNTFEVTAEDTDGQQDTVTHTYTITPAPPKATISSPSGGGTYAFGEVVATAFSCEEGSLGSGLASCDDSNGTNTDGGGSGKLATTSAGGHSYTVTARSSDGQESTATIKYHVRRGRRA
jgi:hypothetical protein